VNARSGSCDVASTMTASTVLQVASTGSWSRGARAPRRREPATCPVRDLTNP
jgi:hypothetical protein